MMKKLFYNWCQAGCYVEKYVMLSGLMHFFSEKISVCYILFLIFAEYYAKLVVKMVIVCEDNYTCFKRR